MPHGLLVQPLLDPAIHTATLLSLRNGFRTIRIGRELRRLRLGFFRGRFFYVDDDFAWGRIRARTVARIWSASAILCVAPSQSR
jgi:hypothetical protein